MEHSPSPRMQEEPVAIRITHWALVHFLLTLGSNQHLTICGGGQGRKKSPRGLALQQGQVHRSVQTRKMLDSTLKWPVVPTPAHTQPETA